MFCHCLEKNCLYNYEFDDATYKKIMKSFDDSKKMTITSLVKQNRKNDFLNFLIVLSDKHYKPNFFKHSLYDSLLQYDFPGNVNIVNQKKLQENEAFIIKDTVILKKLYMRLPKENLYVDSSKYEEHLLHSITNEFLRVISSLKPMSIKLKIYNQNKKNIDFDVNASVSFQGLDASSGVKNQQITNSDNKKEWLLTFVKQDKKIDLSCFLDKTKFYYLPKNADWGELIHNRINYNVNTASYVYEHTMDDNMDVEFLQKMKFLTIDCKYKKSVYENIRFEYEIMYYPL
jgi:hypothetical protein